MPAEPSPTEFPTRGRSLGALFLLTTVAAALFALLTPLGRLVIEDVVNPWQLTLAVLAGAGSGACLGACIGLRHHRRTLGAALGGAAGVIVGAASGPLILVPRQYTGQLLWVSLVGSIVVVIVSWIFRAPN